MPWSIEMVVAWPVTSQRSVEDCPRWIDVGSAENCVMLGAAGGGGGAVFVGGAGGGGGGGAGAFFLQPAAKSANASAKQRILRFGFLNMKVIS
jgi:hypothetical protein